MTKQKGTILKLKNNLAIIMTSGLQNCFNKETARHV